MSSTTEQNAANNPAGRLLAWVIAYKSFANENRGMATEGALYRTLGVPPENKALLLFHMSRLIGLPFEIREGVHHYSEAKPQVMLKWLPKIEGILGAINLGEEAIQLAVRFDEPTIYCLEMCDDCLNRRAPERILPASEAKRIGEEVNELLERVVASNMPYELKRFLIGHLTAIQVAVRDYRLSGTVPLEAAINAAIGSTVTNPKLSGEANKTPEGRRIWEFVKNTSAILGVIWTAMQIGTRSGEVLAPFLIDSPSAQTPSVTEPAANENHSTAP